jgi:phenylpropionate dioxygenase-like ring-hydroxylating dioxygenase large terminal subunit
MAASNVKPLRAQTPRPGGDSRFGHYVRDGRVHSAIYTDPAIFEAEMERIFHRTWLYVGHESEVPKPGDFKLRQMGRQPVILVRGASGRVNVLMNRCRHRGALVAERECGPAKYFKCWWHGWVYNNDGELVEIPRADAYPDGFLEGVGGMSRPPSVDAYRGFVFASLSGEAPPLAEHLGAAAPMLDYLVDASPAGALRMNAGVSKTSFRGNWKFVGMDGYHVETVHASVLAVWKQKANSGLGATHRGNATSDKDRGTTRAFDRGHVMIDYRAQRLGHVEAYLDYLRGLEGGDDYIKAMHARHGEARSNQLLVMAGDPHIGLYPNMQIIASHIRVINPVAVDETQVLMFPVLLEGVPDSINDARLRQHESFYGAAGAGAPDDNEMFERAQRGLQASVDPWIDISRGAAREQEDEDGSTYGRISDEGPQRAQMREWLRLMSRD